MTCGVIYLLTGTAHAARLVVSLASLRKHYQGPITVYTTQPASHEIGRLCREDARLGVQHRRFPELQYGSNSAFLTKLALLEHTPYDVTVHFDCDTLVVGDLSPLFDVSEDKPFCATRFAHWHTHGRTIRKRLEAWRKNPQIAFDQERLELLVDRALQEEPAINGGVFSYRKDASLLEPWNDLARAGYSTFICDEIALQLLLPHHPHQLLDCRFNCSPIYAADERDVRLWHFHGEKHLRVERSRTLWWPAYQEALAQDLAGLKEWAPAGDRRLRGFLRGQTAGAAPQFSEPSAARHFRGAR